MRTSLGESHMHCDCELCAELAGLPSRFSALYRGSLNSRMVARTRNFVVLPSLGQLGDAHLMIVSREHKTAASNLEPNVRVEFMSLLNRVRTWMERKIDGKAVIFENGDPEGDGRMGCTISHLHVHIVASRRPMSNLPQSIQHLGAEPIAGIDVIDQKKNAYSFIEFGPGKSVLIRNRLRSQTLRRLFTRETGSSNWDWRSADQEDQLIGLVQTARAELAIKDGVPIT